MDVDSVSLTNDLMLEIERLLSILLGMDQSRVSRIMQMILDCSGDGCANTVANIVKSIDVQPVWRSERVSVRLALGAVFLTAMMDLAKLLESYGLLNRDFKAWLTRVRKKVERGNVKAVIDFIESSGRLLQHTGCNAHYRGFPINIPLALHIAADALNQLFLLGGADPDTDTRKAFAILLAGALALVGKTNEAFKVLGAVYENDPENIREGTMRILNLCAEFARMYEEGIVLIND